MFVSFRDPNKVASNCEKIAIPTAVVTEVALAVIGVLVLAGVLQIGFKEIGAVGNKLLGAGVVVAAFLVVEIAIWKVVSEYHKRSINQSIENLSNENVSSLQDIATSQDPLDIILNQWIEEAPSREKENRKEAADRIKKLDRDQSVTLEAYTLNLCFLNLTSLPAIFDFFPYLLQLYLSSNNIRQLPESICSLKELRTLELAYCGLETLPESIGSLKNLDFLHLRGNRLTTLPNSIGSLQKLETVRLEQNRLTTLPASLFEIPCLKDISAEDNHFSAETVASIQTQVRQVRVLNSNFRFSISIYEPDFEIDEEETLDHLIQFWEKEFQKISQELKLPETDEFVLKNSEVLIKHPNSDYLFTFLQNAKGCEDFKNKATRGNFALEIHETLYAMMHDKEFCEWVLPMMKIACETCADQLSLFLNKIRIKRVLHQLQKVDEVSVAVTLIGLARLEKLEAMAIESSKDFVDPVEVVLGYQIQFREALTLPLTVHSMKYDICAKKIEEEEAETIIKEVLESTSDYAATLIESDEWVERVKKLNAQEFAKIEKSYAIPEYLPEAFANEQDYRVECDKLKKAYEIAIQEKILELTQIWLKDNRQKLEERLKYPSNSNSN